MPVELRIYQRSSPGTLIGTLDDRWDVDWLDELTEVGAGRFKVAHDAPAVVANPSILDRGNIVRVHNTDNGTDLFAWTIKKKTRHRGDNFDTIDVAGPGVLDILRYAVVYPEYWPSELVADTRIFGFMSSDYTEDASWITPSSRGTQGSRPFGDTRPEGWSDASAEFIADSTAVENNEGWFWLRSELVVSEAMDVRFEATADEAFTLYVAGIPLLDSPTDGEFQWNNTYSKTIELPAGTYQVAAKVWHADRPNPDTNLRWFIFSAMAAGASGAPAAQREVQHVSTDAGLNEIQEVHNDSTTGTFTFSFSGDTTDPIAYNAAAATIEAALETLEDITDVAVSGSGTSADPWVIEFLDPGNRGVATLSTDDTGMDGTTTVTTIQDGGDGGTFTLTFAGETTAAIAFDASASTVEDELNALDSIVSAGSVTVTGSGTSDDPWVVTFGGYGNKPPFGTDSTNLVDGTVSATSAVDGSLPDVLLRSNTADWTVLPLGSDEPGMTPGEILQVLISGAQSRGWAPSVTYDFTAAADSDGTAWSEIEFAAQVGNDSVLSVAHRLGDLGIDVAMSGGLVMSAYSNRGSSLAGTVELTASQCSSIDCNYEDEVINTVLLRTKQAWYEAPSPAPSSDRWEGFLSFGELTSEVSARDIADSVMNTYDDPREIIQLIWADEVGPDPYVDFDVGDWITAPGWTSPTIASIGARATRVLSIAGQETADTGSIEWTVEGEQ